MKFVPSNQISEYSRYEDLTEDELAQKLGAEEIGKIRDATRHDHERMIVTVCLICGGFVVASLGVLALVWWRRL